jgi:hypothetical protein
MAKLLVARSGGPWRFAYRAASDRYISGNTEFALREKPGANADADEGDGSKGASRGRHQAPQFQGGRGVSDPRQQVLSRRLHHILVCATYRLPQPKTLPVLANAPANALCRYLGLGAG